MVDVIKIWLMIIITLLSLVNFHMTNFIPNRAVPGIHSVVGIC